jgi:tRNA threonylcarbamoyladenosine biosynthesis protein TsaB
LLVLILAVDTSNRQGSLAVLQDQRVMAATGGFSDEPYASRLFVDLERVLGGAQAKLEQIELLAVATGPGSFTGLRVGLTAVKAWAEVLGCPIAAVSCLEAVAVQAGATDRPLVAVTDARAGQFFGAIFRRVDPSSGGLQLLGEEVVLKSEQFFQWVAQRTSGQAPLFVSATIQAVRSALAVSPLAGAALEEVSGELATFIGRLGYARALRGQLVDPMGLEANYVRRSDAEVNWRGG